MRYRTKVALPLTALGLVLAVATMGFRGRAATQPSDSTQTAANITRLTTGLLENSQFAHRRFDDELVGTLLERYLDALDGSRSLFLQSDVDRFAAYRKTLGQGTRGAGDTSAARAIFARYLERLQQKTDYVTATLKSATFDFSGHDVYSYDREHAPRPHDLTAARALWWQQLRAEYLQEELEGKQPDRIANTLAGRHVRQLRTMKSLRTDEWLEVYLDTLAHVYDPHSDYLGHEQLESFSIGMKLSLAGIGATLESEDGYCVVRNLVPGGPAAESGQLKPGDRIVAVAEAGKTPVDIVDMPLSRAVELIRGPKGSTVTLSVIRANASHGAAPQTEALVRAEVKLENQEARARIVDLPNGRGATVRLGVIDLPSFYADEGGKDGAIRRSATADVARLLTKLKTEHVRGVVLDLRRNGGGSLDEAITLTGLFIRKGPVVQTRDATGNVNVGSDPDESVAYDGPLVLLTSRFSASASEILAGALQDYGRALVVGDSSTFGKGTVQNVVPLAPVMDRLHLGHAYDPGALKVTTEKFYRPSGASTQLRGVSADIVVPSDSEISDVSESSQKDPLPWDTISAAHYERLDRVAPYVPTLREESTRRIAEEKVFRDLALEIAQARKTLSTKSISLNEAERRQQLAQAKAEHEETERDARILKAATPTTYEITLENASSPGLPPAASGAPPSASAATPADPTGRSGDGPADRTAEDDIVLNEGVRILADYVDVVTTHGPVAPW